MEAITLSCHQSWKPKKSAWANTFTAQSKQWTIDVQSERRQYIMPARLAADQDCSICRELIASLDVRDMFDNCCCRCRPRGGRGRLLCCWATTPVTVTASGRRSFVLLTIHPSIQRQQQHQCVASSYEMGSNELKMQTDRPYVTHL